MRDQTGARVSHIEFEPQSIARAFVAARQKAQALANFPGCPPATLAQAYAVQDAAVPMFGGEVAGWKVGRINSPWFERLASTRLSGPIFAEKVKSARDGHGGQGYVFENGFGAAEAEYIFRIGSAPEGEQTHFTREDAAALVDAVFCGIEIASSPFCGINAMGPLVTIADFGNNNGLLVGAEIADWRTSGFEEWDVSVVIEGGKAGTGRASAFPGGPLESVRFLLENLIARGLPVTPGLLVSSGAVSGVHEVIAGQKVAARFGDYFSIDCTIGTAAAREPR